MPRILPLILFSLLFSIFAPQDAQTKPRHLFKIASLAPEGSVWVDSFKEFASEVTEKTGGEVDVYQSTSERYTAWAKEEPHIHAWLNSLAKPIGITLHGRGFDVEGQLDRSLGGSSAEAIHGLCCLIRKVHPGDGHRERLGVCPSQHEQIVQ